LEEWNLTEQRQDLTLRQGNTARPVTIGALDVALLEDIA